MAALVEKVNVNAQPTTKKIENEEKMLPRKEEKLLELSPRAARLHPEPKGGREKNKGGQKRYG